jgi:hypothetical protein
LQTTDGLENQAAKRYMTMDEMTLTELKQLYSRRHEYIQQIIITKNNLLIIKQYRVQCIKTLRKSLEDNMTEIQKLNRRHIKLPDKQSEKLQQQEYEQLRSDASASKQLHIYARRLHLHSIYQLNYYYYYLFYELCKTGLMENLVRVNHVLTQHWGKS